MWTARFQIRTFHVTAADSGKTRIADQPFHLAAPTTLTEPTTLDFMLRLLYLKPHYCTFKSFLGYNIQRSAIVTIMGRRWFTRLKAVSVIQRKANRSRWF